MSANYPGASPETMAATVAEPLEQQFAQITAVSQITSSSVIGTTQVTLQFDLARNIDAAAADVQTAINAAQGSLPKAMPSPPTYRKVNPAEASIMIISMQSDSLPLTTVDDLAETVLAQQITHIAGVAQVQVTGQQKPALRADIDPGRLSTTGLTLEDVRQVLATATANNRAPTWSLPSAGEGGAAPHGSVAAQGVASAGNPGPHAHHPGLHRGREVHAGAVDRAGGGRYVPVLRAVWATIIPSPAMPLSLVGRSG